MNAKDLLRQEYFGNSVEDYLWFVGLLLFAILFKRVISKYLSDLIFRFIKRKSEGLDAGKLFSLLRRPLNFIILLLILFLATSHMEFPVHWKLAPAHRFGLRMFIIRGYQMLLIFGFTWLCTRFVSFLGLVMLKKAEATESKADDQLIPFMIEIAKVLVWIFGVFIILGSVFHLNIGSLIAGLGIGGLAVALAAKESLENLFASFTIFVDKPFVVGDFVQVGSITGSVEKVGFRSTRLRTLEKTYVTIPNKRMVDSDLDNLTRRTFRRYRFKLPLVFTTAQASILLLIQDIKGFLTAHPDILPDHNVSLTDISPSSLDITIEFFINSIENDIFLRIRQEVNLKVIELARKNNCEIAYQTTTINLPAGYAAEK